MRTIDDVFKQLPIMEMASACAAPRSRVEKWKERRRIPSDYWSGLIQALRSKGHKLTSDDLLAMHERERRSA